jgi:hypothetical protein
VSYAYLVRLKAIILFTQQILDLDLIQQNNFAKQFRTAPPKISNAGMLKLMIVILQNIEI